MSNQRILNTHLARLGWNDDTVLGLLVEYIDNQESPEAFADFLAERAEEEAPSCPRCSSTLEDAHTDPWCANDSCT